MTTSPEPLKLADLSEGDLVVLAVHFKIYHPEAWESGLAEVARSRAEVAEMVEMVEGVKA